MTNERERELFEELYEEHQLDGGYPHTEQRSHRQTG